MGGIGRYSEGRASLMALNAGVDFLLHPSDPDKIAEYLEKKLSGISVRHSANKLFRKKIKTSAVPDLKKNRQLSEKITRMSIKVDGQMRQLKNPLLIILSDDIDEKGRALINRLKQRHRNLKFLRFRQGENIPFKKFPEGRDVIVAVFSGIHAWKGGASSWLLKSIKKLANRADIFVSFGSPYLFGGSLERGTDTTPCFPLNKGGIKGGCDLNKGGIIRSLTDSPRRKGGCSIRRVPAVAVKVYAYWDSDMAQKAVVEAIRQG